MTRVVRRVQEGRGRPRACSCGTCPACVHADYMQRWYERQTPEVKQRIGKSVNERKKIRVARIRAMLARCKAEEGCLYCGEGDPVCLDWHHRDPEEKHNDLATLVGVSASWARIIAEIEKCDVACANCHRKLGAGYEMVPVRRPVLRVA